MVENNKCNAEQYEEITRHISALLWLNENGGWEAVSKRLMPEGYEWPRFTDGTPVKTGDGFTDGIGGVDCVEYISFKPNYYGLHGKCGTTTYQYGDFVERPKIIGKDGKQIIVGETVYGQDAKAWEVTGFRYNSFHSVTGKNGNSVRDLRPEWLSHEKPDTIEAIKQDIEKAGSVSGYCKYVLGMTAKETVSRDLISLTSMVLEDVMRRTVDACKNQ